MNSLEVLKEIQTDLNIQCDCGDEEHFGTKWKSWYNSRLNLIKKDLEELQQIKIADLRCSNIEEIQGHLNDMRDDEIVLYRQATTIDTIFELLKQEENIIKKSKLLESNSNKLLEIAQERVYQYTDMLSSEYLTETERQVYLGKLELAKMYLEEIQSLLGVESNE